MTDRQKALFKQLQLAGLGIVLFVFGLLAKHKAITVIGILVFAFGVLRTIFISKMIDKLEKDE